MVQLPPELSDAVRIIEERKSQAEQWGSVLKGLETGLSRTSYSFAVSLYVDGKAAFDGWIEQLKFDLAGGHALDTSDKYRRALDEAATKATTFVDYVRGLSTEQSRGLLGVFSDLLPALVESGLKIWREFRSASQGARDALLARLDGLKWKPFAEIKKG